MLFFTWLKILRTSRAESKVCILMQNLFCVWFIRYGEIVARASEKIYRKIKTWIVQSYNPFWETHVRMYVCMCVSPKGRKLFFVDEVFFLLLLSFFCFFLSRLFVWIISRKRNLCALNDLWKKSNLVPTYTRVMCVYMDIYTVATFFWLYDLKSGKTTRWT